MRILLIFVTFIAWVSAADGGFDVFCKSDLGGTLEDSKDPKKPGDKTCTTTFDLEGVTPGTAGDICRYRSRFAVKEAKAEGNKLTCTWETTGKCDDGHYIYGFCYKLASTCSTGWELTALGHHAFRWIAYTFANERRAKFRISAKTTKPAKMYSRGQLLPADGKATEMAVLLSSMPVFGGHPGDIVYVDAKDPVPSVCRKIAVGGRQDITIVAPAGDNLNPTNHGSGGANLAIDVGNFTLLPTRNVYQPKLDKGLVDLRYFHHICENICDGCFAATTDYLAHLPPNLAKHRYWLSGGRDFIPAKDKCGEKPQDLEQGRWKLRYHNRHPDSAILPKSHWKSSHPNQECSDQGRYAMAYEDGKVIDVPIFDRLPLVCVRGSDPPLPKIVNNCLKNSENDGTKDGCKCKKGYKDVLDQKMEEQPQPIQEYVTNYLRGEKKGRVCVLDSCSMALRDIKAVSYDSVLLLIDGGVDCGNHCDASWNTLVQFLRDGYTWLTRKTSIFFLQFGTGGSHTFSNKIPADWTDQQYIDAVNEVTSTRLDGMSHLNVGIRMISDLWWASKPVKRKAIMIAITDAWGTNEWPHLEGAVKHAHFLGVDIKLVIVGMYTTSVEAVIPRKDIVFVQNYERLVTELRGKLEVLLACNPMTAEEIFDARSLPYE